MRTDRHETAWRPTDNQLPSTDFHYRNPQPMQRAPKHVTKENMMERTWSLQEARDGNATVAICVTCPECQGTGKRELVVRRDELTTIHSAHHCPLCHGAAKILGTMTVTEFARLLVEEMPNVVRDAIRGDW